MTVRKDLSTWAVGPPLKRQEMMEKEEIKIDEQKIPKIYISIHMP